MRKFEDLRKKSHKIIFLMLLPFFAVGLVSLLGFCYVRWLMPYVPGCVIRTLTGLKCPSCGMTHAVVALARGDLLGAARENIMLPVGLLLGALWYVGLWMEALGSTKKIIPKTARFWLGVLGMWLLYTILRNIL